MPTTATKSLLIATAVAALVGLSACSSSTPGAETPATSASPSPVDSTDAPTSSSASPDGTVSGDTAVTIIAGGRTFEATINDSQVAQDFLATLPAALTWNRNAGIEYIAELHAPLTETGPLYTDVQAGDIVYYNPLDSITIIYAPTSSVPTLTKMGEVASDLGAFENLPDDVDMTITLR